MSEKPLERFLGKKPAGAGADAPTHDADEVDYKAYGINRTGRPALMLDLRRLPALNLGLSYSYLMSVAFDPSGEMLLLFTSHKVTVKGKNLSRIYDAVLSHTLRYLQEENPDYESEGAETFISEIAIEEA
jgi:hypothetical protein